MKLVDGPKKSRGRPAVESDAIKARIQEPDLSALDAFAAEYSIPRPEAVRRILRDWLIGNGYLPK